MNRARLVIAAASLTVAVHGASVVHAAPGGPPAQQTAVARKNLENDVAQGTVTYTPTPTPTASPVPTLAPAPTSTPVAPTVEATQTPVSRWQTAHLWTDADGRLMVNLGTEQIPVVPFGECDGVIPDTDVLVWRMDAGEAINTAYVMWDLLMVSEQYGCVLQIHDYTPVLEATPTVTPIPATAVPPSPAQFVVVYPPTPVPTATTVPSATPDPTIAPTATPRPPTRTPVPTYTPLPTYTPTVGPTSAPVTRYDYPLEAGDEYAELAGLALAAVPVAAAAPKRSEPITPINLPFQEAILADRRTPALTSGKALATT